MIDFCLVKKYAISFCPQGYFSHHLLWDHFQIYLIKCLTLHLSHTIIPWMDCAAGSWLNQLHYCNNTLDLIYDSHGIYKPGNSHQLRRCSYLIYLFLFVWMSISLNKMFTISDWLQYREWERKQRQRDTGRELLLQRFCLRKKNKKSITVCKKNKIKVLPIQTDEKLVRRGEGIPVEITCLFK